MPARAHLACLLALALAAVVSPALIDFSVTDGNECSRDGLFADYDTDCREYTRCAGGAVAGRYACAAGRAFSEAAAACVPRRRQPCVRRACARHDAGAYAAPGSACRHYYRCDNGSAVEHACPAGSWFDPERQACARGAGTCYEPLCAGLPDGDYPDASHECRRVLTCRGGELREVRSCAGPCAPDCPPPRAAAAALPTGDADFCSDAACSSLCQNAADGAYADRASGCREFFECAERRVVRRGVCEPGLLFSRRGCQPAARAACPPPARSPCFNRPDGLHRDWKDCSSWFECRRERVVSRGSCGAGLVFDGAACVPPELFPCEGPEPARECEGLPTGSYQDLESNCTRYFHCAGSLRTRLSCGAGRVFDGARCVRERAGRPVCASLQAHGCWARADGRYRAPGGCRGYYACAGGQRAVYACAPGELFDGDACVPGACEPADAACAGLPDGYHADVESECFSYFYCEGEDRLATWSCLGGKIFDGRSCVEPSLHTCGAPPRGSSENDKYCERDGFYVQLGTECKSYYFCVTGIRTSLTCPDGQVFNGQVCVSQSQYSCPG